MDGKADLKSEAFSISLPIPTNSMWTWPLQHLRTGGLSEGMVYMCMCSSAPQNDMQPLLELESYKKNREAVAKAAIKSLSGNSWYLREILVGLTFFDSEVPAEL